MAPPPWPPGVPPFVAIVHEHSRLVLGIALARGVPAVDVPDCAQTVFLRLYQAILDRRVDATRPLVGWLFKTTRTVARDRLALAFVRHEVLSTTGVLDRLEDTPDGPERTDEAIDVHAVVRRVLAQLTPAQRKVFVMSDIEDTPMDEIIAELEIPRSTAYQRLKAARKAFARAWKAEQAGGGAAVAPFLALSVGELLAAHCSIPEVTPRFEDDLRRRLTEALGLELTGPPSDTPALGMAMSVPAIAGGAGVFALTTGQLGAGALLLALAGVGVHGHVALLPFTAAAAPAAVTTALPREPILVTVAEPHAPPAAAATARGPHPAPARRVPPRRAFTEKQASLLDSARTMLRNHQPRLALATLALVTAPDLAEQRDELLQRALAERRARHLP